MTEVNTGYQPRPLQQRIHRSLKRFNVLVCHRRFGKTVLCVNELLDRAITNERERPRYAYVAPMYKQAKAVAWDYVRHYAGVIPEVQFNEAELRCDLPNGARIQLLGADNPDALRGLYLDGVVLDEYAQMSPRVWDEVIRPALADREGFAIFIGTPMGQNAFYDLLKQARSKAEANDPAWFSAVYKASETHVLPPAELEGARAAMSTDAYAQEFECSFEAATRGAYYGGLMREAEEAGRITNVAHDKAVRTETWWDLGITDATAIWFVQRVGQEIHVIDYYEQSGEAIEHYVRILDEWSKAKKYLYSHHVFPHDVKAKELIAGKTREEVLTKLGVTPTVCPDHRVDDGIEAVRNILPRCWFDRVKCEQGIKTLQLYRKDWDEKRQVFRLNPLHDWTSHGADAFRYGAMARPTGPGRGKIDYPKNMGVV